MYTNYHAQQTPQFRVLSDQQIEKILHASLECLQVTGVNVMNEEARHLLAQAGAEVDGVRVYMPAHLIQDALVANTRAFSIWGRDGEHVMHVAPNRVYYGPGPTCTFFDDPFTGERRLAQRGDAALTAQVCDALPHIDYVMSLTMIDNVTHSLASVYEFAEMITCTSKPVLPWAFAPEQVEDLYKIAVAVAGSEAAFRRRPNFAFFSTMQSPLQHTEEDLANCFWAIEHGIPVIYIGGGSAGATSPITGAGTMVVYLAGILSGLAILQLKKRGAAVCIGGVPQAMDARSGRPAYGSPEMSLYSAAMADISRYLGQPFMGTAGASESKLVDQQAAIECTVQVLLSGLSGATLVHDMGFLDCANIGSLEMLVMNDEIIAMTRRILRSFEVTDKSLMLGLIDQVGPGGEFLSTIETAKQCRTELWTPTIFDRQDAEIWAASGSKSTLDRIKQKLARILSEHKPAPLPAGAAEQIQAVLDAAEAREQAKRK